MGIASDKSLILNKIKLHYKLEKEADLARFLEIAPQTLTNWRSRNAVNYDILFTKCEDLDFNFLLKEDNQLHEPTEKYLLRTDKNKDLQSIPLYNFEAAASLVQLFQGQQHIIDYIHVPNLPPCDGAIYVRGDSMYPLLKAGDIIAYKAVQDMINGIFYGEMYIMTINLNGDSTTVVKYIQKSDLGKDYIKLVSYNQHHSPKDIPLQYITELALIKASIRLNSMA